MWWLLVPVVAALFVGALALGTIKSWFSDNRQASTLYGELIKKRLRDGRYRVVGGVFDTRDTETATQTWEASEIDSDLEELFDGADRVKLRL